MLDPDAMNAQWTLMDTTALEGPGTCLFIFGANQRMGIVVSTPGAASVIQFFSTISRSRMPSSATLPGEYNGHTTDLTCIGVGYDGGSVVFLSDVTLLRASPAPVCGAAQVLSLDEHSCVDCPYGTTASADGFCVTISLTASLPTVAVVFIAIAATAAVAVPAALCLRWLRMRSRWQWKLQQAREGPLFPAQSTVGILVVRLSEMEAALSTDGKTANQVMGRFGEVVASVAYQRSCLVAEYRGDVAVLLNSSCASKFSETTISPWLDRRAMSIAAQMATLEVRTLRPRS